jgi:hypothetical protein
MLVAQWHLLMHCQCMDGLPRLRYSNVGSFSYTSVHVVYEIVPLGFEGRVKLAASSSIPKASES